MINASTSVELPPLTLQTPAIAKPRLGFLGTGWIGRHRLESIQQSGLARVTAIADSDSKALQQTIQGIPAAQSFNNLPEMLNGCELDGVVIATPSALHAEQCTACLNRGLAVFCQKPLARSGLETATVVRAAAAADRLLGVDFSYRFLTGAKILREFIQEGRLGQIFAVRLIFHNAYGPDKKWFYDPLLSGGGCLIDLGTHLVDLLLWLFDEAPVQIRSSKLFSKGRPFGNRVLEVEDYAQAQLLVGGQILADLACSWHLNAGFEAEIECTVYGTDAGVSLHNLNGSFYEFALERFKGTRREVVYAAPEAWGGKAAVEWARLLARSPRYDARAEEFVRVAQVLDQIYEM